MALKIKSFRGKTNAFLIKSKLSFHMQYFCYQKQMSQIRTDQRYWIFVFKQTNNYKYKTNETKWISQIKVWDTKEAKWVNTIIFTDLTPNNLHIDYAHHLIMFTARSTLYNRVHVYNLFLNKHITNSRINHKKTTPVHWNVLDEKTIIFNDDHLFYELAIGPLKDDNKLYSYDFDEMDFSALRRVEKIIHINENFIVVLFFDSTKKHQGVLFKSDPILKGQNEYGNYLAMLYKKHGSQKLLFEQCAIIPTNLTKEQINRIELINNSITIGSLIVNDVDKL